MTTESEKRDQSQRIQQFKATLKQVGQLYLRFLQIPALFLACVLASFLFVGIIAAPIFAGVYVELGLYPWHIVGKASDYAPSYWIVAAQIVWMVVVLPVGVAFIDVLTSDYV